MAPDGLLDLRVEALLESKHSTNSNIVLRSVNLASLNQATNLGTDHVPDTIEWGVKDSTERFDRDMGVSAGGLGEGCRAVNEFRMIAIPRYAVIVGSLLILVGGVLGDNGGITGESEGGEIGRHCRHVA